MKSRKATRLTTNERPTNARRNTMTYRPSAALKRRLNATKTRKLAMHNAAEKELLIERRPATA
jgi:hypothetical protein